MSVFTPLTRVELEDFFASYDLGRLKDFQGTLSGAENTNYFISLEGGEFVLTLIEHPANSDLPFCIELLDRLHEAGLPVPRAVRDRSGQTLRTLAEKPALLQLRLDGRHIDAVNAHHCQEVGILLARLHLATRTKIIERKSDRGLDWMLREGPIQALKLEPEGLSLLRDALAEIRAHQESLLALPLANLHADLFRDNVLFDGNRLSGVIDFYNACSGPMLYDLAITLNDWCSEKDGRLNDTLSQALLGAYAARRPFSTAEIRLWPVMLRVACIRFWLSRLIAQDTTVLQPMPARDPHEFQRRLHHRRQASPTLPMAL